MSTAKQILERLLDAQGTASVCAAAAKAVEELGYRSEDTCASLSRSLRLLQEEIIEIHDALETLAMAKEREAA